MKGGERLNPREKTIKELEALGYVFHRHGANHDIYRNAETRVCISVKRHDFDENDARYILKEAKQNRK